MKHIPTIHIETVAHSKQRYPTVGDWILNKDGSITIRVSQMKNWRYEFAVALHEAIEVLECIDKGITQEQVDKFDWEFEILRGSFPKILGNIEPGNMETAPYFKQHKMATNVEQRYIYESNILWKDYDDYINNL